MVVAAVVVVVGGGGGNGGGCRCCVRGQSVWAAHEPLACTAMVVGVCFAAKLTLFNFEVSAKIFQLVPAGRSAGDDVGAAVIFTRSIATLECVKEVATVILHHSTIISMGLGFAWRAFGVGCSARVRNAVVHLLVDCRVPPWEKCHVARPVQRSGGLCGRRLRRR